MKHSCVWASYTRTAVWDSVAEQVRLKNQNGIKNQRTAATILKGTASQVCAVHVCHSSTREMKAGGPLNYRPAGAGDKQNKNKPQQ